jgi:hypothetical protein
LRDLFGFRQSQRHLLGKCNHLPGKFDQLRSRFRSVKNFCLLSGQSYLKRSTMRSHGILGKCVVAVLLLLSVNAAAQKKTPKSGKPIKLQAKTDNHKISFEMETDVFYFTNTDLILFFQDGAVSQDKYNDDVEAAAINYLKNYHKEIEYKKGQTKFNNAGERSLYTAIEAHLKAIILSGRAADMQKGSAQANLFILTKKCESDSTKQTLTEKKGRVVLECK